MREHMGLFRGKRKDTGDWVEGNLVKSPTGTVWIAKPISFTGSAIHLPEVDPDTIGECTGLRDKNGKLIFEGDCLGHHMNVVEITNGEWCVNGDRSLYILSKWYEIIGNIHDNPELLKEGADNG